ncbi:hypothetical protein ARALYDRAFT_324444 [Arabidopsis lyrata subsp. lyrata]|uniref:Uncharacterized protein n=1 Tax=Arabidopsis lyrata subsp. lyrata TaxID=81972 RepID=D7LWI5_ARALL|nr:hypothetical protein ARALYDRAFT_324444 [Arabidopsis lyrata subsp. lyrata]
MAFKAMRKNRTRRRYECLSSSAGTTKDSNDDYDFFPFAAKSENAVVSRPSSSFVHMEMNNVGVQQRHRRGWSVGDFSSMSYREGRRSGADGGETGFSPSRRGQLLRNRSHRLFSCVSAMHTQLDRSKGVIMGTLDRSKGSHSPNGLEEILNTNKS